MSLDWRIEFGRSLKQTMKYVFLYTPFIVAAHWLSGFLFPGDTSPPKPWMSRVLFACVFSVVMRCMNDRGGDSAIRGWAHAIPPLMLALLSLAVFAVYQGVSENTDWWIASLALVVFAGLGWLLMHRWKQCTSTVEAPATNHTQH